MLHLQGAAASHGALAQTIRAMLGIGDVSIYSGCVLDAEAKEQLVADVKAKLFEVSRENENANNEEVFRARLGGGGVVTAHKAGKQRGRGQLNGHGPSRSGIGRFCA